MENHWEINVFEHAEKLFTIPCKTKGIRILLKPISRKGVSYDIWLLKLRWVDLLCVATAIAAAQAAHEAAFTAAHHEPRRPQRSLPHGRRIRPPRRALLLSAARARRRGDGTCRRPPAAHRTGRGAHARGTPTRLQYSGGTCWRRRAGSDSVAGVYVYDFDV